MTAKLTLTIEADVIEFAKEYAASTGKSLSGLVENYLKALPKDKDIKPTKNSSTVGKLKGIISLPEDFDYKKMLADDYTRKNND